MANIHQLLCSFSWVRVSFMTAFCKLEIKSYSAFLIFSCSLITSASFLSQGEKERIFVWDILLFFSLINYSPYIYLNKVFLLAIRLKSQIVLRCTLVSIKETCILLKTNLLNITRFRIWDLHWFYHMAFVLTLWSYQNILSHPISSIYICQPTLCNKNTVQ